jgi:enoyl-CoA hydratase/carnithine racemase
MAVVRGQAVGAAVNLMLATDLRIVGESAGIITWSGWPVVRRRPR